MSSTGEIKGGSLPERLAAREIELADLQADIEAQRPDHLAPTEDHVRFLGDIAAVVGRRQEVHELLEEM